MPYSVQHLRAKRNANQRKRRTYQICPCNVCQGKTTQTTTLIARHLETFGRAQEVSSSDEDEQPGPSFKKPRQEEHISDNSSSESRRYGGVKKRKLMSSLSADDEDQVIDNDFGNQTSTSLDISDVDDISDADYKEDNSDFESDVHVSEATENELEDNGPVGDGGSESEQQESILNEDIYSSEKALLPIYQGSNVTLLQALAGYFSWFTEHPSTSKSALTSLLLLNKNILPHPNNLPKSYEEALSFIKPFLSPSKVYHACPNDCILFRKTSHGDYSTLTSCPECGSARYTQGKNPARTFHYCPLGPRWKRMYGNATISELLQKHKNGKEGSKINDVQDSAAWKTAFAGNDPRSLMLQLSTDGVNPFSSNKVSHSMWPIMLTMLNLPRNVRNLFGNMMLAGIIPAQKGGGEPLSLSPYLEVVVDELLELSGATFYDSLSKTSFGFKAKILNFILDFPGLGKIFNAAGPTALQACMWCDLRGMSLSSLDKVIFIGNRRFLPINHSLRKNTRDFPDHKIAKEPPPEKTVNEDILWNAVAYNKAANKTQAGNISKGTGSKGVNCFMLLPEHNRTTQAFPDMMHTLKNVVVAFFDLFTGKGDSIKVRNAEKDFGRFKGSWMERKDLKEKTALPPAPFRLSKKELQIADNRAKSITVPSGYGWKPFPIFTKKTYLKSHDWKQIAVDGILKFCLRGLLGENQRTTFFELLDVLTKMFNDSQDPKELDSIQLETNIALAKVERDFPVSIQTISLHILHHIVDGIKLYGPIHSWWMYSYERFNSWICQRVKNRRYPAATVMETYRIFDWVQFMRLSGQLQTLKTDDQEDTQDTVFKPVDHHILSEDEETALRNFGLEVQPNGFVKSLSLKMKCSRTGKIFILKSGEVVFLTSGEVGVVKYFLSPQSSNDNYVTLNVFHNVLKDRECGLMYVHKLDYSSQTLQTERFSGTCITAPDDNSEDILWVLNAPRASYNF